MKLHSLITCLVLGATLIASAQTAAGPEQPTAKPARAGWHHQAAGGHSRTGRSLRKLSLQPGSLQEVVEQLRVACSKGAQEGDSKAYQMPTLTYGPGATEAKVAAAVASDGYEDP